MVSYLPPAPEHPTEIKSDVSVTVSGRDTQTEEFVKNNLIQLQHLNATLIDPGNRNDSMIRLGVVTLPLDKLQQQGAVRPAGLWSGHHQVTLRCTDAFH